MSWLDDAGRPVALCLEGRHWWKANCWKLMAQLCQVPLGIRTAPRGKGLAAISRLRARWCAICMLLLSFIWFWQSLRPNHLIQWNYSARRPDCLCWIRRAGDLHSISETHCTSASDESPVSWSRLIVACMLATNMQRVSHYVTSACFMYAWTEDIFRNELVISWSSQKKSSPGEPFGPEHFSPR